jgi:hypothetical protein
VHEASLGRTLEILVNFFEKILSPHSMEEGTPSPLYAPRWKRVLVGSRWIPLGQRGLFIPISLIL